MKLGLNLSFAVKRWQEPDILAKMVREDFGITCVQLSWDQINPWWPDAARDRLAEKSAYAFRKEGITITSTFGGLASYSYGQLLSASEDERRISLDFLKRAVDMSVRMGVDTIGTPVGGMSNKDAYDPVSRQKCWQYAVDGIMSLAAYGAQQGLKEILIEATPLETEFPSTPDESVRLMKDLEGSAVPVRLLVDWGHALYQPLLKEKADMELWLKTCRDFIGAIHLQQTDGKLDRHWGFSQEGLVTPGYIKTLAEKTGTEDIIQYLEVVPPFEAFDADVYREIQTSVTILKTVFA
ncbi:MAG: sugar phosphate isomerase/epimerase family protein [Treponema sp.]